MPSVSASLENRVGRKRSHSEPIPQRCRLGGRTASVGYQSTGLIATEYTENTETPPRTPTKGSPPHTPCWRDPDASESYGRGGWETQNQGVEWGSVFSVDSVANLGWSGGAISTWMNLLARLGILDRMPYRTSPIGRLDRHPL